MPSPGAILLIGIVLAIMIAYTLWYVPMPVPLLGVLLAAGVAWLASDYWVRAPRERWLPRAEDPARGSSGGDTGD